MQIHGATHVHSAQPINAPHHARTAQPAAKQNAAVVDQLDISREADIVSRVHELPDIRADRVAELRASIQSGAYETADKLDVALDRLLDEFA